MTGRQQIGGRRGLRSFLGGIVTMKNNWVIGVPKPPVASEAKPSADAEPDIASRAGGCPEGMPCKHKKPRDYYQSIALGQQLLKEGSTTQAIDNFKQTLWVAGSDEVKQQEVYGNLGLAYTAASDDPVAQAYLEEAGAREQAPAWIKEGYKSLLSSQKLMTVEYMERKLQAEKEIEQEQTQLLAADEESSDAESGSERRGFIVGKSMTTAMIVKGDYRPKPAEAKAKPKIVEHPKYPGPNPVASTHVDTISAETSLGINMNFTFGSAVLTPEGQEQADELGKLLQQKLQGSDQVVVLVGHTDIIGSDKYNDHLSEQRANAVKFYLISKFPDLKGKLSERGMGKRQPIYKEMDEESQRLNRRVEVKLSRSTE